MRPFSYTPLRYPGGKTKLGDYLAAIMRANRLSGAGYAEPYAGGAGAGLYLLFRGYASHLYLNDIDRGVTSFWIAVLRHNERFARQIEGVPLTVAEWDRQKEALMTARVGFELGFAFFYLNRTNRSGIMNGGIIGGRQQAGEYTMEARFNRIDLVARVRALAAFRQNITISRLDALEFLDSLPTAPTKVLTYLDPPYFAKGQKLYTNFYTPKDHADIAAYLQRYGQPWLMTYDACQEIRALYPHHRILESTLSYSAREVRRGEEIVILGPGVRQPTDISGRARARGARRGFELV